MTGRRFWRLVGAVFALHLAASLLMTQARAGFFLFTIPVVLPVYGAESWVGRALWLLLVDTGAVAAGGALVALGRLPASPEAPAGASEMGAVGHALVGAAVAIIAVLLAVARDQVFVIGVVQPTASGVYGTVQHPVFDPAFSRWVPLVLVGAGMDVACHVVFALTRSVEARMAARTATRLATAAVLLFLATVPVFDVGRLAGAEPGAERAIVLTAVFGLMGLGLAALAGAVRDWLLLMKEVRAR